MAKLKTASATEQGRMTLNLGIGKFIRANFDGGQISSNGRLLLLQKADQQLERTELAQFCFGDSRRQDLLWTGPQIKEKQRSALKALKNHTE